MNAKDILTAAKNMGKFSTPQQPQNNVSQFIAETFDKLFGPPKGELVIVKNILIMQANADPGEAGAKLVTYHRMFEEWFYANKKVQEETQ